jgi:hypothetical protein
MAALSGRQAALALISDLAWNSDLASMRRSPQADMSGGTSTPSATTENMV